MREAAGGPATSGRPAMSGGPRDPRVARSRRVVIEAAVELLVERGFAATTVEAIATRSGAAKTTIYRHWPDKAAVLREAMESIVPVASAPDTGSLRGDLIHFTEELADILATPPTSALVPGLVDVAERDAELARLLAEFTANRRRPVHAALTRAIERSEISRTTDPELITGLLLGPLFYRRLLTRQPLDAAFLGWLVDTVLGAITGDRG
jgi:AcrR family transcriptional regulator